MVRTTYSILSAFAIGLFATVIFLVPTSVSAHCDSYDGPVIKDAVKALENNNVKLVLKWITPEQEKGIVESTLKS